MTRVSKAGILTLLLGLFIPGYLLAQSQTFTSSGSFIVPDNIYQITVECWGGGGAGGGATGNPAAGGGGAGGNYVKSTLSVTPGTSYTVTVAGIKTATATSSAATNKGNPTWFGSVSTIFAAGGNGGAPVSGNSANGAAGTGNSTGCIGDLIYAGGSGSVGNYTSGTPGGAGGGGAGSTGPGGNASGGTQGAGTSLNGGNGANGVSNSTAGAAGSNYGGGGSGGKANNNTDRAGGSGAAGLVIVSWSCGTISSFPSNQSFDGTTFPPSCWSIINAGSGNNWTRSTSTPYAGAGTMFYGYSTTAAANAWAFTPGFNLIAGHKYTISFYQKVASATYPEKLKVTVGSSATVAGQTTIIWNNAGGTGLTNTTYTLRTADYVCVTSGTYYFAFNCYSDADMYNLFVDEISIADAGISCDFSVSRTGAYTGQTISYTDVSGTATSWSWNFGAGAVPATASTQGPHNVSYTTSGLKTVALTINGSTNTTKTDYVSIAEPLPPRQLTASLSGFADVNLSWLSPAINESFEPYDDFDLSFGTFTFRDVDGGATYGIQDVSFLNSGYTGSFIEFNPSQTSPALPASWVAHSGIKYAACFAALTASAPNNDWIISPKVKIATGEQLKFWAKSITATYGLERFKVGISTTGTQPADFTIISSGSYVEAPITWTEFTYSLSAYVGQEIYIAINCVSNDAFCFLLDDLSISGGPTDGYTAAGSLLESQDVTFLTRIETGQPSPQAPVSNDFPESFSTYKIFRNSSEIGNTSNFSFSDPDLVPGTYNYTVKAVYIDPAAESTEEGPVEIITNITRWTGASDNDWQNSGNWRTGSVPASTANIGIPGSGVAHFPQVTASGTSCNNLTIKSGANLTILPTANLTVNGALTNESGNSGLLIKSDASGTGSLIHSTAGIPATVERYIPNDWKWHFLSSPVANQSIWPEFAPTPSGSPLSFGNTGWAWDFYTWNPNANLLTDLYWVNLRKDDEGTYNDGIVDFAGSEAGYGTTTPAAFTTGRGYLVAYSSGWNAATGSPETHAFAGTLNTGAVNRSILTGSNTFNLAGNPYASSIDWKAASGWDRDDLALNGTGYDYWIYNDNLATGNYGVFNSAGSSGTNGVSQYIAPEQAFFVKAQQDGILGMDNAIRTNSNQSWLKAVKDESNLIRLKLTTDANTYSDEIIVEFDPAFSDGGSDKFWSFYTEAPELYSIRNGYYYSIDRYSSLENDVTVHLGTKAGIEGNYTLSASNAAAFNLSGKLLLEDLKTGIITNLKTNTSYTYYAKPTDDRNRFILHVGSSTGMVDDKETNFNVYVNNKSIYINNHKTDKPAEVDVCDMLGHKIHQELIQPGSVTRIDLNVPAGIYLVSIATEGDHHVSKVLIR